MDISISADFSSHRSLKEHLSTAQELHMTNKDLMYVLFCCT